MWSPTYSGEVGWAKPMPRAPFIVYNIEDLLICLGGSITSGLAPFWGVRLARPVPARREFGVVRLGRDPLCQTAKLNMPVKKVSFKMHSRVCGYSAQGVE